MVERTEAELEEARALHTQETRRNEDLQLKVQALQSALEEATATRRRTHSEATPRSRKASPRGRGTQREPRSPSKQSVRQPFKVSPKLAFPLTPPADDRKANPLASRSPPEIKVTSPKLLGVPTIAIPIPSRSRTKVSPSGNLHFPDLPKATSPINDAGMARSPRDPIARPRIKSILRSPRHGIKISIPKPNSPSRGEALPPRAPTRMKAKAAPTRWQY
jgi:hypothetical protein